MSSPCPLCAKPLHFGPCYTKPGQVGAPCRPPCECGNPIADWKGDRNGHRRYLCNACCEADDQIFEEQDRMAWREMDLRICDETELKRVVVIGCRSYEVPKEVADEIEELREMVSEDRAPHLVEAGSNL